MRDQEMMRQQMNLAYKTGDTAKANKLMELLAPEDPLKKETKRFEAMK
jgi:hypothetical protein